MLDFTNPAGNYVISRLPQRGLRQALQFGALKGWSIESEVQPCDVLTSFALSGVYAFAGEVNDTHGVPVCTRCDYCVDLSRDSIIIIKAPIDNLLVGSPSTTLPTISISTASCEGIQKSCLVCILKQG